MILENSCICRFLVTLAVETTTKLFGPVDENLRVSCVRKTKKARQAELIQQIWSVSQLDHAKSIQELIQAFLGELGPLGPLTLRSNEVAMWHPR